MPTPIIDFHCDTLSEVLHHDGNLMERPQGHLDIKRLQTSGVGVQVFALFSNPKSVQGNLTDALTMIELFWQAADAGYIAPILWREDLSSQRQVLGGMLSMEGGEPLGTDLRMLQFFFRLGVRAIGLTWNGRNALADGVGEKDTGGGLTTAGRQMVAEMNRLGMLVDVSHLSETGFWQIVALCQGPFIASHSNCYALCPHPRNLTDAQLKAIAAAGGVVGINFLPRFLHESGRASSDDIVRHAEHMLKVMGRGHIGLGSDFDGISTTPVDVSDVSALPHLDEVLTQHFGAEITQEIMGTSFNSLLQQTLPLRPTGNLQVTR